MVLSIILLLVGILLIVVGAVLKSGAGAVMIVLGILLSLVSAYGIFTQLL
jgi:uncharacterized membrane protein